MQTPLGRADIVADTEQFYDELRSEHDESLVAPLDDMWATFADQAAPHALLIDGRLVASFSVDDEKHLHRFFVRGEHADLAPDLFAQVVADMGIVGALASTVEPAYLSLSLAAGGPAVVVGLMYEHIATPTSLGPAELRAADPNDLDSAVAFDRAATDSPESFVRPFLTERIGRGELYLLELDGAIAGTGECRIDDRSSGFAQVGVVVGTDYRGRGLATSILHTVVNQCRDHDLAPLCSTEPDNFAARRAIRRAGFANHHRVFRVAI